MAGTPCYIPPEVFRSRAYSKKGDIWSCGVILYALLVGYLPFDDPDSKSLQNTVCRGDYDYYNEDWKDITDQAKDLVDRMLTHNPNDRFSARDVLRHPWVARRETVPSKLHRSKTIEDMREFNKAKQKWKKFGHTIMLTNKFKKLMKNNQDRDANLLLTIASMGASGTFGASSIKSINRSILGKKMQTYPDDLGHFEDEFKADIIALTQNITEATLYNNTELTAKLYAPDCSCIIENKLPELTVQGVSINDPIVHMIGMNGACISYKKHIVFLGEMSNYETVEIPETRVWKNFGGKWHCIHYHT